jgi:hypothetical protein
MCNDDIPYSDPEVVRQFPDRYTAQIHECLWFCENDDVALYLPLSDMRIKEGLIDGDTPFERQLIQNQKTCVVSAEPILYPRISQSYD